MIRGRKNPIFFIEPNRFTKLNKLTDLILRDNSFDKEVLKFLDALPVLKYLDLYGNKMEGSLLSEGTCKTELCSLKKLEELDLSSNHFEGIFPPCLNNLTSLTLFAISYNRFSGIISSTSIANLTTLMFIDLSNNLFGGNWSPSLIASMTSLENIDLSNNLFEGLFPFSSFYNHSKLKVIQLMNDNNNKLDIETENPT